MKLHELIAKHPTIKNDFVAYTSGAGKTFDNTIQSYIREVETVERAIRLISNILSLCKYKTFKESPMGLKEFKVKNVDLLFLNELDSYVDFNRKLASSLFTQGASIILSEQNKDKLRESDVNFYVYNPADWTIESDGSKLISKFIYTAKDGTPYEYKPEQVLYINDSIDPSNLLYSLSRLKALNDVILMQAGIVAKTKQYSQGGAKDSLIISAKDPIGDKQQDKIKKAFDEFTASTTSKSILINSDLSVDRVSNSMTGAEMLEFFKEVNQIILDQFNLPPALLGDYSASGANKNEELLFSLRVWFTTVLKPVIKNIGLQFTKYFRNQLQVKNVIVELDVSEIDILDDFIDAKVDRAIKLHKAGLMSLNEARALAELPELDGEAATWHYMPQYLLGAAPITYENYDAEVERLLQGQSQGDTTATGNSGGDENTSVTDGTRGGDAKGDTNAS